MRLPLARKMALWSDFEGRMLEGRYRLNRLVRSEGRVAWFDTESSEDRRAAVVSVTETLNDEDALLERLRAVSHIRHPNVVAIHEVGATKLDGTSLVYAVMEPVEENLSDVLRRRTLTAAETRQVVNALVEGLGAVHEKGLVHGRIEASSVLAVGETVKLRSDCLQTIEPGIAFEAFAAEDLRGVSTIIGQALPQRLVKKEEGDVRVHPLQTVPVGVIRHEVKNGGGVVGIAAALKDSVAERPAALPSQAASSPSVVRTTAPEPVTPVIADFNPVAVTNSAPLPPVSRADIAEPAARVKQESVEEESGPQLPLRFEGRQQRARNLVESSMTRKSAPYIAGAAVIVLIALLLLIRGMLHSTPAPASAGVASSTAPAAVAAAQLPAAAHAATPAASVASEAPVKQWRVVAYTYNQQKQAEQKAEAIAAKHPQFMPEVFSPNRTTYLVTLGGAMDREQSFSMRGQALRAGMPGDTYARNFRSGQVVSAIK